jgi:hypothetical protein
MTGTPLDLSEPLATSAEEGPPPWSWRSAMRWMAIVLIAAAAWFWWQGAERRALLALPPAARQAVYHRELENFERLCTQNPSDSLADECRHRAWVLSWLPECDASCRAMIGRVIPLHQGSGDRS